MAKIAKCYLSDQKTLSGYLFYCPGCKYHHLVWDQESILDRPFAWEFNKDFEKPTFKPSLLINKDQQVKNAPQCHLFITDGMLQYQGDCTHELKGKTVEMEDI